MSMTEQEANDRFEDLCGNPDRAFHVMRLWQSCWQHARGKESNWRESRTRQEVAEANFRKRVKENGFSEQVANFYINYIQ